MMTLKNKNAFVLIIVQMLCSTAVIFSNNRSVEKEGNDAVIVVKPSKKDQLQQKIKQIVQLIERRMQ